MIDLQSQFIRRLPFLSGDCIWVIELSADGKGVGKLRNCTKTERFFAVLMEGRNDGAAIEVSWFMQ